MYDAWAAFDDTARGYYLDADAAQTITDGTTPADVERQREEAISTAAWVVLTERYKNSPGADDSLEAFDEVLSDYCVDRPKLRARYDSAAALGLRIGNAVLAQTIDDGSLEANGYEAGPWNMVNPPLAVDDIGTTMSDPNRWQPLEFPAARSRVQQKFTTPHWGSVVSFAMDSDPAGLPIDPGMPPLLGQAADEIEFKAAVLDVIRFSSILDPDNGLLVDASPRSRGANSLGTDDGIGHLRNPIRGGAYESNMVPLGDYGRVLAEFWADGPESETPPGHWNTLANEVSDREEITYRIEGTGDEVDRLEWDVKLYFALNPTRLDDPLPRKQRAVIGPERTVVQPRRPAP